MHCGQSVFTPGKLLCVTLQGVLCKLLLPSLEKYKTLKILRSKRSFVFRGFEEQDQGAADLRISMNNSLHLRSEAPEESCKYNKRSVSVSENSNPLRYPCLENPHGQRRLAVTESNTTKATQHTHTHIHTHKHIRTKESVFIMGRLTWGSYILAFQGNFYHCGKNL